MHKKAERSDVVPFGDFTWCANRECPKALICGRSVMRLDFLPKQVLWCMSQQPDETGSCDFQEPYRTYADTLVKPELKMAKDDVVECIEIIRKMPDEDGKLDVVQAALESVEERLSYLFTGFEKEKRK